MERDKQLIQTIIEGREDKFYNSRRWRKLAKEIKTRDNNECQQCKSRGYVGSADCVHHIIEIKVNPLLALTTSNLMTVCNKCHNIIHDKLLIHNKKTKPKRFISEERW